ncbi:hypothetical protein LUZ60_008082 [Juncus effusus]|nr:hypothetical protein LUZ60_008082 [Juncus effusus]
MDLLQRRLRQELSGRRYLLVLDDVSRLDGGRLKLKKLCSWLKQGGDGSFIIVTIRDEPDNEPNGMTMSRVHEYKLGFLYYKESWELFCRRAFTTGKWEYPELLEIGKIFIEMCYGVPFNLNLLGSLMRFKKEYAEWLDILHQLENFRKLRAYAILQVCWNNLHPDTKRCLAFCSVFPSDSHIDKDVMIKLWIANGLIGPDGWANPEVRGNQIFNELVTRYFFRDVKCVHRDAFGNKHEFQGRIVCKMSGIVCDFARYIASSEYSRLKLDQPMIHTQQQARFVSISSDSSLDIAMSVEACPVVSTLISPVESFAQLVKCNALPKSNTLRVLHLRSSLFQGDLSELKYMKHLTYLDLSGSRIKTLPEAMSTLYSMQTLNLSKCLLLCHLPKGMRYMRSLRHLSVDRCPKLKKMPAHLGELSCLQTLTTYIICEDAGCGIDEIKGLNLGGLLELYNIRKVKDALEAKEVDLFAKQGLESLTLCWGGRQNIAPRANNCFDVLEALKPHVGLKVLKIQQYGDPEFSAWLANPVDLKNLVELHLILCTELKSVPMVWHLPCLRVLCLKYMDSLSYIHNSTSLPGGSSEGRSRLFPALKRLMLVGMKSLNEWQEGEAEGKVLGSKMLNFPVLDEMEIIDCPKLEIMPTAPCLKHLTVKTENPMLLWSVCCLIAQSSSLVEANITNTSSTNSELPLTSEKESENYNKCSLRRLRLDATNHFFMSTKLPHIFLPRRSSVSPLSFWRSFELLEYLDIFNCNDLEAWPQEELECLIRLRRLSIRVCKRLTGSSAESSKELTLPRLESLQIYGCPRLKKIPMCSSSLKDLELDECPEITSISSNECPADLETLYISCTTWTSLPNGLEHLTKLKSLRVTECYSLTNLPDGMRALTSLKSLIVNECPRVKSLPQCSGLEQVLSGLELLKISRCPDLELFCGAVMYRDIISRIPRKIIGSTD